MLGRWSAFSGLPAPPCIFLSSLGRSERRGTPPKPGGGPGDSGLFATVGPVNTPCRRPPIYTSSSVSPHNSTVGELCGNRVITGWASNLPREEI